MNILLIPSWYPPNGGGFFKDQAELIVEEGNEVSVIYVEECSLKDIFRINPILYFKVTESKEGLLTVFRLKILRLPIFEKLNFHLRHLWFMQVARVYLRRRPKPDISHVHSSVWGGYVALKLWEKHKIPYVITEHRGRFNSKHKLKDDYIRKWYPKYLTPILGAAKKILPVTKYQIKGLRNCSNIPVPDEKFKVIPNIFKPTFEIPPVEARAKKNSKINLLAVAVFETYKNHELLIEAGKKLVENGYTDFIFNLAGRGPKEDYVRSLVESNNLTEYFNFLGYCDKETLIKNYQKSDFMVLTSLSEGQPVAIIESFAMGLPVIVPDLVTDDVVNSSNSLVYRTGDLDDFYEKLLSSFKQQGSFDSKGMKEYAINNFSASKIIPSIIEVYKNVIA